MVDAHAFYFCQSKVAPRLTESILEVFEEKSDEEEEEEDEEEDEQMSDDESGKDTPAESEGIEDKSKRNENLKPLTDDECMLATPRVKGFDLHGKEWCKYTVDALSPDVYLLIIQVMSMLMTFTIRNGTIIPMTILFSKMSRRSSSWHSQTTKFATQALTTSLSIKVSSLGTEHTTLALITGSQAKEQSSFLLVHLE